MLFQLNRSVIIPEFATYQRGLSDEEIEEIAQRLSKFPHIMDRFHAFTDVLIGYVESGEWQGHSSALMAMCARGCFLRGMYNTCQTFGRRSQDIVAKAYAAAAHCKQSFDPKWINTLRQYVNQLWHSKKYPEFAELAGQLVWMLNDFGHNDQAREIANDTLTNATDATRDDADLATITQIALLDVKIVLADLTSKAGAREEALTRLDAVESAARQVDHELAQVDIQYCRGGIFTRDHDYDKAIRTLQFALAKYEQMGHLDGVAKCRNQMGIVYTNNNQLQEARDQFEELMVLQQELGSNIGLVRALVNTGEVDKHMGHLDLMESYNKRALEICKDIEYLRGAVIATMNLGDAAVLTGRFDEALSRYREAEDDARRAGMRDVMRLVRYQIAGTLFLKGDTQGASEVYTQIEKMSKEVSDRMNEFCAIVGRVATKWASKQSPQKEDLQRLSEIIGDAASWTDRSDTALMRSMRAKILNDPSVMSDMCVFYDIDGVFQCMVERLTLHKECYGNLFWKGTICPYFRDFMTRLNDEVQS